MNCRDTMKIPSFMRILILLLCLAGVAQSASKKPTRAKKPAPKEKVAAPVKAPAPPKTDTVATTLPKPTPPPAPIPDSEPAIPKAPQDEISKLGLLFGMGMVADQFSYKTGFFYQLSPKIGLEGTFKHVIGSVADHYFISSNLSFFLSKKSAQKGRYAPYVITGIELINSAPNRGIGGDRVSNMSGYYGLNFRKSYANDLSLVIGAMMHTVVTIEHEVTHIPELSCEMMVGGF
jgi:hypothetical protein